MKRVLITGITEGLGMALHGRFLSEGWFVVGCSRSAVRSLPDQEFIMPLDVSDATAVQAFAAECQERFESIDVIINNASILGPRLPISEYPVDQWQKVIDINLNGSFYIAQVFIPLLAKGGMLLNISSGAGVHGGARWGAYAASKFAIEGLTQVLSSELSEQGIRVHSVDPGAMRTTMRADAYPAEDPNTLPTPDTIAEAIYAIVTAPENATREVRILAHSFLK